MSQLEKEFGEIIASARLQSASERETLERSPNFIQPGSGVKWQFGITPVGERPYIQVSCSGCRTMFRTELLDFKWSDLGSHL